MRTSAILLGLVASLVLGSASWAAADDRDGGDRAGPDRKGPPSAADVFSRIDKDDDGAISQEEFKAAFERFRRMHHGKHARKRPGGPAGDRAGRPNGPPRDWRRGPRPGPPWAGGPRGHAWDRGGCCCCCRCGHPHERYGYRDRRGPRPGPAGPARGFDRDRGPRRGPPHFEALFKRFDENNDAKLTEQEVPAPLWQRISRADRDDDQSVTKDEFRVAIRKRMEKFGRRRGGRGPGARGDRPGRPGHGRRHGPPKIGQILQRFDANDDGKLSQDEVPEGLWARISRADQNGDGLVTKEELKAARKLHRKQRPEGDAAPAEKPDDDDDDQDDDAS